MVGIIIGRIACLMLVYHGISLFGCITLGRWAVNSKLTWLYAITSPTSTSAVINSVARLTAKHLLWTIGSIIVLCLL